MFYWLKPGTRVGKTQGKEIDYASGQWNGKDKLHKSMGGGKYNCDGRQQKEEENQSEAVMWAADYEVLRAEW